MIYVNDNKDIDYTKQKYILYFYANWLNLHEKMVKLLNNTKYEIDIYAINIERVSEFVIRYELESLPTIVFIKDKEIYQKFVGMPLKKSLESEIRKFIKETNEQERRESTGIEGEEQGNLGEIEES